MHRAQFWYRQRTRQASTKTGLPQLSIDSLSCFQASMHWQHPPARSVLYGLEQSMSGHVVDKFAIIGLDAP